MVALIDNYEKVFFVLVMYILPNQEANLFWIEELFYREFPNNFARYSAVPLKYWIFLRIATSFLLNL